MTPNPKNGPEAPVALAPSMTPERWRVVDVILQSALVCERDRRDAYVRDACGNDEALRTEVASLLAAHDAAPSRFLERGAAEAAGMGTKTAEELRQVVLNAARTAAVPPDAPVARRMVSANAALFVTVAAISIGVVAGWGLAHESIIPHWKWTPAAPALWKPRSADAGPNVNADVGSGDAGLSLVVVNRDGVPQRTISANRPWTPRFSPDGRRVAYGAFGSGRQTSDVWVTDLSSGNVQRLTDDDADSNDPQWSPDGRVLAYSVSATGGKDIAEQPLAGGGAHVLASRPGTQFPSDWLPDGKALLVTDEKEGMRHDVIVQPTDGSEARPYVATSADETTARMSPDGHWIAYTSDESGQQEVYIDSYPSPGHRLKISSEGGVDPVWRHDGSELYYWCNDALMAVNLGRLKAGARPVDAETVLFHAPYQTGLNTMYDVSPDGQRFVIVEHRSR